MAKDMRTWLAQVAQRNGELVRVRKELSPHRFQCSAIAAQLEEQGRFPVVLFERLRDLDDQSSPFRLVMNMYGTMNRVGLGMGLAGDVPRVKILEQYLKLERQAFPPVRLEQGEQAPVQEVVLTGAEVNLRRLAIPRDKEMDGGPYFTPIVVARDETGRYNTSWNRCMYVDERHMGIHISPRHLWSYFNRQEQEGRNLPMALVVGHHPAFLMSGAGLTAMAEDEYAAAGGLLGESLRVAASVTYGDQLLVPADAEMVIEGELVAGQRTVEGPYGEFTYYSGPQKVSWLFEVKAVTYRKDPILSVIYSCSNDHLHAHLPIEASIFARAKEAVPTVVETCAFDSGAPLQLVIAMKKTVEGQPMRAAMAAMAASNFIKHVIVVDDDIDPTDWRQVMWAMCTRVQADQDVTILKGMQAQLLDPSTRAEAYGSGMIIDATRPVDRPYAQRARVPKAAIVATPLAEYLEEGE